MSGTQTKEQAEIPITELQKLGLSHCKIGEFKTNTSGESGNERSIRIPIQFRIDQLHKELGEILPPGITDMIVNGCESLKDGPFLFKVLAFTLPGKMTIHLTLKGGPSLEESLLERPVRLHEAAAVKVDDGSLWFSGKFTLPISEKDDSLLYALWSVIGESIFCSCGSIQFGLDLK